MSKRDESINSLVKEKSSNRIPTSSFFCNTSVKQSKDGGLKKRLQTLIYAKGMSEPEFFHKLNISRQYWYFLSWGIWKPTLALKVKIAQMLGTDSSVIWESEK